MAAPNKTTVLKYSAVLLGIIVLFAFGLDMDSVLSFVKSQESNPLILLFAVIFLPLIFFPMSPLLILVGLSFDTYTSLLIILMAIPVHLFLSYLCVKWFFKDIVEKYANKHNFRIFNIPKNRRIEVCFLVMSIPGLPYALKNYLLSVSSIPFKQYLLIGWLIQFLMCLPFILLGDAASNMNLYLFSAFIFFFILIYVCIKVLRKKLSDKNIDIKTR